MAAAAVPSPSYTAQAYIQAGLSEPGLLHVLILLAREIVKMRRACSTSESRSVTPHCTHSEPQIGVEVWEEGSSLSFAEQMHTHMRGAGRTEFGCAPSPLSEPEHQAGSASRREALHVLIFRKLPHGVSPTRRHLSIGAEVGSTPCRVVQPTYFVVLLLTVRRGAARHPSSQAHHS